MSLFVLASKDGWVNIMYTGLDAVGVDMQVSVHALLRLAIGTAVSHKKWQYIYDHYSEKSC